ncbi:MAG: hypothetical protein V1900_03460 [Candidatus Aenigmatarchaeota archaeon]
MAEYSWVVGARLPEAIVKLRGASAITGKIMFDMTVAIPENTPTWADYPTIDSSVNDHLSAKQLIIPEIDEKPRTEITFMGKGNGMRNYCVLAKQNYS